MINSSRRPVVAFRTHVWDSHIEVLARRLSAASGNARFVVLADETNGTLDVGNFEKLAHTNDFSDLGLLSYPPPSVLWYNGEYPLYRMRRAFPDASAYAMVEFDVSTTADLSPVFDAIVHNGVDVIAHDIQEVDQTWGYFHSVGPHFAVPAQAMIHSVFVSPRAIDHMLDRRKQIADSIRRGEHPIESWPFCEGFVPSAVRELPNARIEELRNFVNLPYYIYGTPLHIADPQASAAKSMIHPVLSGSRFINKRMEFDNPSDVFDPSSSLSYQLRFCLPIEFVNPLIDCFKRKQPSMLLPFLQFAAKRGWLDYATTVNLALGCPADQSSFSQHSRFSETSRDAAGGNDGDKGGGYGFWTAEEHNPYWQVDLGNRCQIDSVVVFNFLGARDQCTTLAVLTSNDSAQWSLAATKLDNHPFGGADGEPFKFEFQRMITARFVRVQLIGHGALHLDEIEVFGLPLADEIDAELAA